MGFRFASIIGLCILLWRATPQACLSPEAHAFSALLPQADLVVTGYVQDVEDAPQWHRATFKIEDVFHGTAGSDVVHIGTPKGARGARLAHTTYMWASPLRLILFLKFDAGMQLWHIINGDAGLLKADVADDVRALIQAYRATPALFSTSGADALIALFEGAQHRDVKDRLLYDLEKTLTPQNAPFLARMLDAPQETHVIFGALIVGRLQVEALRHRVETLLTTHPGKRIKFHCIVGLGDLAHPDSRSLVLSYLNDPDPGTRRAAIEAAGKIGGSEIVSPLKASYAVEPDIGHRLAIITAIGRLPDREAAKETFQAFQPLEMHPIAASILQRRINAKE